MKADLRAAKAGEKRLYHIGTGFAVAVADRVIRRGEKQEETPLPNFTSTHVGRSLAPRARADRAARVSALKNRREKRTNQNINSLVTRKPQEPLSAFSAPLRESKGS